MQALGLRAEQRARGNLIVAAAWSRYRLQSLGVRLSVLSLYNATVFALLDALEGYLDPIVTRIAAWVDAGSRLFPEVVRSVLCLLVDTLIDTGLVWTFEKV